MRYLFLIIYFVYVFLMGKTVFRLFENGKTKVAMIGLFLSFLIIPDFIILDAFKIRGTFVLVFVFICLFPLICIVKEHRIKYKKTDLLMLILLLGLLIYALYTRYIMNIIADYWRTKFFDYIYCLLIPMIIVIIYQDDIILNYNDWKPVLLYAIIAYAFKNYSLAGILGFRDNYLNYDGLKNVIFAAQVLSIGTIICLYDLFCEYSFRTVFYLTVLLLQVLLFESRGPILSTTCSAILMWWFHVKRGRTPIKRFNSHLIVVFSAFILVFCFGFRYLWNAGYLERIVEKLNMFTSGTKTEARYYIYPIAWTSIKQHFPFGVGFGNAKFAIASINSYFQYNYPHNIILELLLEEGTVLTIPFVILFIKWFSSISINDRYICHTLLFFTLYFFSFICAMFSGDIVGNKSIFVFGFLAYETKLLAKKQITNRKVVSN